MEAAKLLGLDRVPVIQLDHLSEAQKRAYVIADNRLAEKAGWDQELLVLELQGLLEFDLDFDVEITGFETAEIDLLIEGLADQSEEDQADALPECYGCHVTGHGDPAGYDPTVAGSESLLDVQCEVCHDKGSRHTRDGGYGSSLLMETCVSCHNPENSPDFDLEVYWLMMEH